jgi:hypothetical protein
MILLKGKSHEKIRRKDGDIHRVEKEDFSLSTIGPSHKQLQTVSE